jgi:hypothetical protein
VLGGLDRAHIDANIFWFVSIVVSHLVWYRGIITLASSDSYTWNVQYDDGDHKKKVCPRCVRRFEPYKIDEQVEVRFSEETSYSVGRIVAAHSNGEAIRVELYNGKIVKMVLGMDIRRVTARKLSRGDRVSSQYQGEWSPGVIAKVNKDGTFAIQYDDGFFSPIVPRRMVLPRKKRPLVAGIRWRNWAVLFLLAACCIAVSKHIHCCKYTK